MEIGSYIVVGERVMDRKRTKRERRKEELWLLSVLFISMNCQAQLRLRTSIDFCRLAWFNKYLGDCGRCDIYVLISLSLGYDLFLLPRFGFELCVLALLPIDVFFVGLSLVSWKPFNDVKYFMIEPVYLHVVYRCSIKY